MIALQYEGRHWTQVAAFSELTGLTGVVDRLAGALGGPFVKFCLADLSGDFHERLVNLDGVRAICDDDLSDLDADLKVPIPRWNVIGRIVLPSLDGALQRLARLELDRELTVKLFELEGARRANGGVWSESWAASEASTACPRDHWTYAVTPDGAMTIAFSRDVDWSGLRGVRLPLRFTIDS